MLLSAYVTLRNSVPDDQLALENQSEVSKCLALSEIGGSEDAVMNRMVVVMVMVMAPTPRAPLPLHHESLEGEDGQASLVGCLSRCVQYSHRYSADLGLVGVKVLEAPKGSEKCLRKCLS